MNYKILLMLLVSICGLAILLNERQKTIEAFKKPIGESVVLGKDTLIIIDYSEWNSTYQLSNGAQISPELITKIKLK